MGVQAAAARANLNEGLGFESMRDGIKVAAKESILTPRFYTTGEGLFDTIVGAFRPVSFRKMLLLNAVHYRTASLSADFAEMEDLFSKEINPNLDMEELNACLQEFRNDYNKCHFVRNETFKVCVLD